LYFQNGDSGAIGSNGSKIRLAVKRRLGVADASGFGYGSLSLDQKIVARPSNADEIDLRFGDTTRGLK
jgi:hypothetical protein